MRTRTRGFTLIELLVVIAIIAVLVSLLVARGAAGPRGRSQESMQEQLEADRTGSAQLSRMPLRVFPPGYVDLNGNPNSTPDNDLGPGWGWATFLLPYMDQGNVYNQINFNLGVGLGANAQVSSGVAAGLPVSLGWHAGPLSRLRQLVQHAHHHRRTQQLCRLQRLGRVFQRRGRESPAWPAVQTVWLALSARLASAFFIVTARTAPPTSRTASAIRLSSANDPATMHPAPGPARSLEEGARPGWRRNPSKPHILLLRALPTTTRTSAKLSSSPIATPRTCLTRISQFSTPTPTIAFIRAGAISCSATGQCVSSVVPLTEPPTKYLATIAGGEVPGDY